MRICVFCGSSSGNGGTYVEAARAFGRVLAEHDIGLVYGGARVGLMGAIADAALEHDGEVVGVIPRAAEPVGELSQLRAAAEVEQLAWLTYGDRRSCAPAARAVLEILHARGQIH